MDDLRRPTGFLFALLGAILLLYGLIRPDVRAALDAETNVNLWCGLTLLLFGGCLLWLSFRTKKS
jgi:drug/metabolite transporter (DMT)-like permease